MKSALRPWHRTLILALVFLIHGSMLLMFIMVEMQGDGTFSEPTIMIAQDEPEERMSEQDWVALNNSLPNTQMATLHEMSPPSQDEIEEMYQELSAQETLRQAQGERNMEEEQKIDEAIDLASQFLEVAQKESPQETIQETREEPKQEEKIASISSQKSNQKEPLSFAQIAQGFAAQIAQVDMAVESNRQGPANMTMVVMVNYFQKVLKNIGESYSITNRTAPNDPQAQDAHVMIALNKDGTLHSVNLMQSSGNQRVDNYLLQLVKHASSSFPPVPSAIKENPLRMPVLQVRSLADFRHIHLWRIKA